MAKILVVDDDVQILEMLRKLLEQEGYEVVTAGDGNEAKVRWYETNPDLLITDIVMPEKEGLDLILELQRDTPNIKVIAISGGDRIEPEYYLELAQIIGAYKTMAKPFNPKDLLNTIAEVLQ
jgi:DNA-binding NtrC family response regulator